MSNNSGKSSKGVVDMSAELAVETYKPPPVGSCQVREYPIEVTTEDRLMIRMHKYRGKVVDFAIQQMRWDDEQGWREVARIDCCGGMIHRHQFNQAGVDVWDHRKIVDIPTKDPWDVVDAGFTEARNVMFNEFEENVKRWQQT